MKAFIISIVLLVVVSIGAAYALDTLDWSSANQSKTDRGNVRL